MGFWPKSQKTPRLRPKNTPHNGQKCLAKNFFVAKKMAKNAKNRPHNQKFDPHKNAKNHPPLASFGQIWPTFFDQIFQFLAKNAKNSPHKISVFDHFCPIYGANFTPIFEKYLVSLNFSFLFSARFMAKSICDVLRKW